MRFLLGLLLILLLAAGGAYLAAGYMGGPTIEISQPQKFLGTTSPLNVAIQVPNVQLSDVTIVVEQNGKQTPVFTLAEQRGATLRQEGDGRVRITREIGKQAVPDLHSGPARIVVTAARPVLYGIRKVQTTATRDVQVRLERPRVSISSTHHYVNLGGSEMVVYRVTPQDVRSGVMVGDLEYPGFPASGVTIDGVKITDPSARVAFFALLFDQDLNTPIRLFARCTHSHLTPILIEENLVGLRGAVWQAVLRCRSVGWCRAATRGSAD